MERGESMSVPSDQVEITQELSVGVNDVLK